MLKAQSVSVWDQAQTQEHPKILYQHKLVYSYKPNTILSGDKWEPCQPGDSSASYG